MSRLAQVLGGLLTAALVAGSAGPVRSQAAFELAPTQVIPRDYETWSLFLVCNPGWVIENGDRGIAELFRAYRAFGRAIGSRNLAVWFWKAPAATPTLENTDIERMSDFCRKYELLPSRTPQVVATTAYPGDPELGDRIVANLGGSAQESARALTDLADQLLKQGLDQSRLDANERWRRIAAAGSSTLGAVGCYLNKVSISIKTGVVNAEIAHSGNSGC